jgi:hypothetical protein
MGDVVKSRRVGRVCGADVTARVAQHTPDDVQRNCPKHVKFHYKLNLRN